MPYVAETPVSNTRKLLFYYRMLPDHRFLFGARGDASGTPRPRRPMRAWMERRIGELFPPWRGIETEYFWRGLVCLSLKLAPSVGRVPDDPSRLFRLRLSRLRRARRAAGRALLASAIGASNSGDVDVPAPVRASAAALPGSRVCAARRSASSMPGYGIKEWVRDRLG